MALLWLVKLFESNGVLIVSSRESPITATSVRNNSAYRATITAGYPSLAVLLVSCSHYCYSAPVGVGVLWSTRLCVCLQAYLWNRWTDLHEILSAHPPWPWLGPPPAALRCVMYFPFYGWRHVWPQWAVWTRMHSASRSIAHVAALRDLGGVWCLWMICLFMSWEKEMSDDDDDEMHTETQKPTSSDRPDPCYLPGQLLTTT